MGVKAQYRQIADTMIGRIRKGEYAAGGILPTLDELQKEFGIGRVTAQNILRVLVELGYASASRGRKTVATLPEPGSGMELKGRTIALIFGRRSMELSPMIPRLVQLVQHRLLDLGAEPRLLPRRDDDPLPPDVAEGYIVISLTEGGELCCTGMGKYNRPLVGVDLIFKGTPRPCRVNLYMNLALLKSAVHVLEMGMTNFVLIGAFNRMTAQEIVELPATLGAFERAYAGFLRPAVMTLMAHGFGLEHIHSVCCDGDPQAAAAKTRELLEAGIITKGTAFLAGFDHVAMGICRTLIAAGWQPQRDFCVVGAGDQPEVASFIPAISGLDCKLPELCEAAVESLWRQFMPGHGVVTGKLIESEFHIRDT